MTINGGKLAKTSSDRGDRGKVRLGSVLKRHCLHEVFQKIVLTSWVHELDEL